MGYYPLFLKLERARILLAGAGGVGRRKAADLIGGREADCGQPHGLPEDFLWLDPDVPFAELAARPEFFRLRENASSSPRLVFERRHVRLLDLDGRDLVFAATGSRDCNAEIARACAARRILCNVIDAPEEGTFIVPAHFKQDDITLALSTGGRSPALASRLRRDLQSWLGGKYGPLLTVLARLRPLVLALEDDQDGKTSPNCELFRSLVNSGLTDALYDKDMPEAERLLRELLPAVLHPRIGEILHELY